MSVFFMQKSYSGLSPLWCFLLSPLFVWYWRWKSSIFFIAFISRWIFLRTGSFWTWQCWHRTPRVCQVNVGKIFAFLLQPDKWLSLMLQLDLFLFLVLIQLHEFDTSANILSVSGLWEIGESKLLQFWTRVELELDLNWRHWTFRLLLDMNPESWIHVKIPHSSFWKGSSWSWSWAGNGCNITPVLSSVLKWGVSFDNWTLWTFCPGQVKWKCLLLAPHS